MAGRSLARVFGWALALAIAIAMCGLTLPPSVTASTLAARGRAAAAAPVSTTAAAAGAPAAPGFVAANPARVFDTRSGAARPAGSTTNVAVLGRGGVPTTGVAAVAVNITAITPAGSGYLTVYPAGVTRPTASNLNFRASRSVSNQVIGKLGTAGQLSVFASATTHFVIDVTGYYPAGGAHSPLTPSRVLDSRAGTQPAAGSTTNVTVLGRGGVPTTGVGAVILNVTAVAPAAVGYITEHPTGSARPTASSLNYVPGVTHAGMVIAKLGTAGQIAVYTSAKSHLLVDVAGWIPAVSDYTALTPSRILDTRLGTGAPKARVPAGGSVTVQISGRGGVPATGVAAVEVNATIASPAATGFVNVYPTGVAKPNTIVTAFPASTNVAGSATVKLGTSGRITLSSTAAVDLIVDVTGYFKAPAPVVTRAQLGADEQLVTGQALVSPNGAYRLIMQADGNLVVYGPSGAIWDSGTTGRANASLMMQGDGNLVIRSGGSPVWASDTVGVLGARIVMGDDGNLVMFDRTGRAAWSSRDGFLADRLLPNQVLTMGQRLVTRGGIYSLEMQGDGNLVVYRAGGTPLWASNTSGPAYVVMQSDGNLVVYRSGGGALWASRTVGASTPTLIMQGDGNLVIYDSARRPVWASNTAVGTGTTGRYNAGIIAAAARYADGAWGGQCLVFAEALIRAAGGPSIAMGYNVSTYQSQWARWADRIPSLAQAQPGDIIQWYDPNGVYGAVHTSVLTGGTTEGSATVVDSNYGLPLNQERVHRGSFSSRNSSFHAGTYMIWRVRG